MRCLVQAQEKNIFFVDDNPKIRRLAKLTLEQLGVAVTCFEEASDCLRQLRSQRCDLLIYDLEMPDIEGVEYMVEAKRIVPGMPVLMITSYADFATASAAMGAGVEHIIEKPIHKDSLLLKVRSLLNKRSSANQPMREVSSEMDVQSSEERHGLRERILDVAAKLFADNGFRGTSIREIAGTVHCNIAAVNYYFHGKENLYIEVFRRHMDVIREQRIEPIKRELAPYLHHARLELLIRLLAEIFLEPFITGGYGPQLMRLVMHERQDPHLPRSLFLNEIIRPVRSAIRQALLGTCPGLSRADADLCLHSIVAQLLSVVQAQDFFDGLDQRDMPLLDVEKSINHIVRFSAAGIRQYLDVQKR